MAKRHLFFRMLAFLVTVSLCLTGCGRKAESAYASPENWAYLETDTDGKAADVFFINPTVYLGGVDDYFWPEYDEATKESFVGAINMEKGIYDSDARFFAPYYHQASLSAYQLPRDGLEKYLAPAYEDIKEAFAYYLEHYNNGRPIILAGFSQGGDFCVRLIRDFFDDPKLQKQLIAGYAIGWYVTPQTLEENPQIRFAEGESDTGVLVCFTCEAPGITESIVMPGDVTTRTINPLNWKTDGTPADKSLNKGACFTDYSGSVVTEIPELTGCYVDDGRGTLRVTDVTPQEYPPLLPGFAEGVYHYYDYQFFYRNLQENVRVRTESFLAPDK